METARRVRLVKFALVALAVGSSVVLFQWTAALAQRDGASIASHNCGASALVPEGFHGFALGAASPGGAVFLSPEEDLDLRIRFLTARGYRTSSDFVLLYKSGAAPESDVFPVGSIVPLDVSIFKRDSDSLELRPVDHVVYFAQSTNRGVNVRICFNADTVPPGRYQGVVQLADPKLQASPIPMVITVQENRWQLMVLWAALAVVLGTVVLYVNAYLVARSQGSSKAEFWEPQRVAMTLIGAAIGVGAVWAVYLGDYYSNEAFGARGMQYVLFGVACFAAFMGASTLTTAVTQGVAQGGAALVEKRASTEESDSEENQGPEGVGPNE
jgi:hypothetical protein